MLKVLLLATIVGFLVSSIGGYFEGGENFWLYIFSYLVVILGSVVLFAILPRLGLNNLTAHLYLFLSNKVFIVLNILPFINLDPQWIMEGESEHVEIYSVKSVLRFINDRKTDLVIMPLLFMNFILSGRFGNTEDIIKIPLFYHFEDKKLLYIELTKVSLYGLLIILYALLVFILDDAEIKMISYRQSSKGINQEIQSIRPASSFIRNLILYSGALNIFLLLTDSSQWRLGDIILSLIVVYFVIFSTLVYYFLGDHEFNVNRLRTDVLKNQNSTSNNEDLLNGSITSTKSRINNVLVGKTTFHTANKSELQIDHGLEELRYIRLYHSIRKIDREFRLSVANRFHRNRKKILLFYFGVALIPILLGSIVSVNDIGVPPQVLFLTFISLGLFLFLSVLNLLRTIIEIALDRLKTPSK